MSFLNSSSKEINCKIVYYGPGLCGKTTNLQYIYKRMNPHSRGRMISLATETERTLFFDFLPLAMGGGRGGVLRRLPAHEDGRQRGVAREPEDQPAGAGVRTGQDPAGHAVQQARHQQRI